MRWLVPVFLATVFLCCAAPPPAAAAGPRETPVVLAVQKASPAVVNISTETVTRAQPPFRGFSPLFDEFFRDFFGDVPGPERRQRGLGSGVLIQADGTILTNEHVIQNASRIVVTRASGEEYEARLVGADSRTDLAVLKVDAEGPLPFVPMGTSADLMIGETVIAIGNPFGLSHTVTTGVVSALNRTIRGANERTYTDFIQTDASINPGNSGGPLLNILGELVGINSAIYQRAEGIGFAIPIDKARRIVESLLAHGRVQRAWLGLHVQDLTADLARHFGVVGRPGVLVTRVFEDSPAYAAGLDRGDVLLELDGMPLRDRDGFFERLAGYTVGTRLRLRVAGRGGERTVEVEAREIPADYATALSESWLGLRVEVNSPALARRHGLATQRGLVVAEVRRGSAAAGAGIEPGDVVRQVNGVTVDDTEQYREALLAASQRETVVLLVQRGRAGYYVSLNP
ncbi:MAG: Do family serine endopeptidase [Deferrisomatales bacterium]|nr:Do family serine endopeptidase [Deferrisomatales bacterium]